MNNNYIVVGDSITYGIGDYESGGWSAMFKKFIVNKDTTKTCNNFVHIVGFPGATSTDILNKIEKIINSFKDDIFKNIIILSIGINDAQEFQGDFKSCIDNYKSNMEKIIEKISDNGFEIIIIGLTKIESDENFIYKPNTYSDNSQISEYDKDLKLILGFDSKLKEICNDKKILYIQMQDVLQKKDFVDGIHPNRKGHEKIFERLKEYIKE